MSGPGGRGIGRLLAEGVLIVSSVYLAIFLEGLSQEADRRAEARVGLEQLVAEMRLDLADIDRIRAFQLNRVEEYARMATMLADPTHQRLDSLTELSREIYTANYTLYPRKGAWTTLRDGGLLSAVSDQDLVVRIADHYENFTVRVEYNGALYDEEFFGSVGAYLIESRSWPRTGRVEDAEKLRSRVELFSMAWTEYYVDLIGEYGEGIEEVVGAVEAHLEAGAG